MKQTYNDDLYVWKEVKSFIWGEMIIQRLTASDIEQIRNSEKIRKLLEERATKKIYQPNETMRESCWIKAEIKKNSNFSDNTLTNKWTHSWNIIYKISQEYTKMHWTELSSNETIEIADFYKKINKEFRNTILQISFIIALYKKHSWNYNSALIKKDLKEKWFI